MKTDAKEVNQALKKVIDQALEAARQVALDDGVPEELLQNATGLLDIQQIRRQWKEAGKDKKIDKIRELSGLPSLRNERVHKLGK